jgi:hypothetical protein
MPSAKYGPKSGAFPSRGFQPTYSANEEMGSYAEAAICIQRLLGSPGTQHMIRFMERIRKPVYVERVG